MITVEKKRLVESLSVMQSLGCRSTMPILTNVLLRLDAENKKLKMAFTNLEERIEIEIPCEFTAAIDPCFDTTINLKDFQNRLKLVESDLVGLAGKYDTNELSGSYLYSLDANDFPCRGRFDNLEVTDDKDKCYSGEFPVGARFFEAIQTATEHSSKDYSRRVLNGVFMGKDCIVGTDRKRLVIEDGFKFGFEKNIIKKAKGLILPKTEFFKKTACRLMKKVKCDAMLSYQSRGDYFLRTSIFFDAEFGLVRYFFTPIEGTYPNYKQVIPNSFTDSLKMTDDERENAIEIVRKMIPATSVNNPHIDLNIKPEGIEFYVTNASQGDVKMYLPLKKSGLAKEYVVKFNPIFLLDALRGGVIIRINCGYSPLLFESKDGKRREVLMPIRPEGKVVHPTPPAPATVPATEEKKEEEKAA